MRYKIGLIVNPHAGKRSNYYKLRPIFERILGQDGKVYYTKGIDELPDAVADCFDNEFSIIALIGGDGSTQALITEMIFQARERKRRLPMILPLGGGTLNSFPKDVGVKGKPLEVLRRTVHFLRQDNEPIIVYRDALKVNDVYGFGFGNGVSARMAEYYYQHGERGLLPALIVTVKIIGTIAVNGKIARWLFEKTKMRITVDDGEVMDDYFTGSYCATIPSTAFGVQICYNALSKEGYFHAIITKLGLYQVLRNVHNVYLGRKLKGEGHYDMMVKKLLFETEEPNIFIIDGDMYPPMKKVTVEIGPTLDLVVIPKARMLERLQYRTDEFRKMMREWER